MASERWRTISVAAALAAAGALALAAVVDLGPFGDGGAEAVAELPAPADCTEDGAVPLGPPAHPPREPGEPLPLGFNDGAYLARQDTPAESAAMQRAAGSAIWRSVAQWQVMEPQPGRYDFSTTDPFYCAALAAGIAPLIHITTSPTWAADPALPCPPHRCTSPPLAEHLGRLRAFAAALVARYPRAIAIEAWNEPNLSLFWSAPDPERYVGVLRAVHDGVEAVDPSMPVLMGGLSDLPADDPATGDISLTGFLGEALAHGAGELVDGFNVHLYPQAAGAGGDASLAGLDGARAVLAEHGFDAPRIWVTETGIATGPGVTRDEQAAALLGLYAALEHAPDIEAMVVHTLVEPNAAIVGGDGYGWVSQRDGAGRFRPFPVYCRFARLLAEPLDCSEPAPS